MDLDTSRFWLNGRLVPNTGGMMTRSEGTRHFEDSTIDATFDDNFGTALWLERTNRCKVTARIVSSEVELGNAPLGTDGVNIQSNCYGNEIHIAGNTNAVFGATAQPALLGANLVNNAGSQNSIKYYDNQQVRGAAVLGPTTVKSDLCNIPVGAGHKLKIEATIVVTGAASNDLAVQIRTNNTPLNGWYTVEAPPKTTSSTGSEVYYPSSAYTVTSFSNANIAQVGLLGTPQVVKLSGYVEMDAAGVVGLYAGPLTADANTIAVQYSELKVTRVG